MSVLIKKTAVSLAIPKYLIRLIHLEARAVFFISLLTVCRDSYVRGVRTAGAQRGEALRLLKLLPEPYVTVRAGEYLPCGCLP